MRQAVILVDLKNMVFRSFFGAGEGNLFAALMLRIHALVRDSRVKHIVFCTDGRYPLWRLEIDGQYKQHRETNEDLKNKRRMINEQMPMVYTFIQKLGFPLLNVDGIEADDLIGIVTERVRRAWKWEVLIVSNDRDYYGLLREGVIVYQPSKHNTAGYVDYTVQDFQAEYGIVPELWPHVKALSGDSSDNLKGLYKVGAVKALAAVKAGVRATMTADQLPEAYRVWAEQWNKAQETYKLVLIPRSIYDLPEQYRQRTDRVINSVAGFRHVPVCSDTQAARLQTLQRDAEHYGMSAAMVKLYQYAVSGLRF